MRVDIHAHFFTFQLFLTAAAEANLQSRLVRDTHMSPAAAKTVVTLLKAIIQEGVGQSGLWQFLKKIGMVDHFAEQFVKTGCLPSISAVADAFFDGMSSGQVARGYVPWPPGVGDTAEELVTTALMMDVVDAASSQADLDKFAVQYRDTVLQAIRYPGRLLPFVAFNPLRGEQALKTVEYALDAGECVGVKLYPSLGYDANEPVINSLLAICAAYDAPIIMHCNDGGFCGPNELDPDKCFPGSWSDVVENYDVRIDFAHFGEQNRPGAYTTVWRDNICTLMAAQPEKCFTDLSYQSHMVKQTSHSAAYADWLRGVMAKPISDNVLFGTDFFMSCMETDILSYWSAMAAVLGPDFDRVCQANAERFLGFEPPSAPGADDALPRKDSSLERHACYLRAKGKGNPAFASGAQPASWLTRLWAERPLPRP